MTGDEPSIGKNILTKSFQFCKSVISDSIKNIIYVVVIPTQVLEHI